MIRSKIDLERWLAREIWEREIAVEPPRETRREQPARDWEYRAWIRTLPCAVCGSTRYVEAAHTGSDGGMSQKSSDHSCVPLCRSCHTAGPNGYHRIGKREFERRHGSNSRASSDGSIVPGSLCGDDEVRGRGCRQPEPPLPKCDRPTSRRATTGSQSSESHPLTIVSQSKPAICV
jgi:hypothetical protein